MVQISQSENWYSDSVLKLNNKLIYTMGYTKPQDVHMMTSKIVDLHCSSCIKLHVCYIEMEDDYIEIPLIIKKLGYTC